MTAWIEGPINESKARSALGGELPGLLANKRSSPNPPSSNFPTASPTNRPLPSPVPPSPPGTRLFETHHTKPGDTVLVLGTGGVSIFALQFARMAECRVIATSSSDQKLEHVREIGASDGINYRTTPDWDKKSASSPAATAFTTSSKSAAPAPCPTTLRKPLRSGGTISLIGVLSGPTGEVNPAHPP